MNNEEFRERIATPVCGLVCNDRNIGGGFAMTATTGLARNDRTIGGWFAMDGGNAFSGRETEKESPEGLSFYSSI